MNDVETSGALVVSQSREVLRTHARSFSWGAVFLPADARDDAALLYAWCRHVDDLVDEATSSRLAAEALAGERAALRAAMARRSGAADGAAPRAGLTGAFLDMADRRALPLEAAEALIDGMASDLGDVQVADDAELLLYCYRAAGAVGLLMCGVIGAVDEEAAPYAVDLGMAMQLTNICRDVLEDAERGRVYLPRTRLLAAGVEPGELLRGTADPAAVAGVVRDLLGLAEAFYRSGHDGMRFIPPRTRVAIRVAGALYREIGRELVRRGGDPLRGRTVVPRWRKAWTTAGALLASLVPVPSRAAHAAELHALLPALPGVASSAQPASP